MEGSPRPFPTPFAKAAAALALLLAMAAAGWTVHAYKKLKSGIASTGAEVAGLKSRIGESTADLAKIQGGMAGVRSDLATLKSSAESWGHSGLRQAAIADQAAQAGRGFVLLVGDTVAEGLYLPTAAGQPALNGGISGTGMEGAARLLEIIPGNAQVKMVVIHTGLQDATRACVCPDFEERWEGYLRKAVDSAIARSSGAVAVSSIIPVEGGKPVRDWQYDAVKVKALNGIIRKVAAEKKIILIDNDPAFSRLAAGGIQYTSGGVHLNRRGYDTWRENINAALAGAFRRDASSGEGATEGPAAAAAPLAVLPSSGHIQLRQDIAAIQAAQIAGDYLLVTGDSVTEQLYMQTLGGYPVLNAGFGGGRARDVLDFLLKLPPPDGKMKAIVIAVGVNDAWSGGLAESKPEFWRSVYISAVDRAKALAGDRVFLSAIIPLEPGKNLSALFDLRRVEALNEIIRSVARDKKVILVDNGPPFKMLAAQGKEYTVDGVHLNNLGFATWRENLQMVISGAFGGGGTKSGLTKTAGAAVAGDKAK